MMIKKNLPFVKEIKIDMEPTKTNYHGIVNKMPWCN